MIYVLTIIFFTQTTVHLLLPHPVNVIKNQMNDPTNNSFCTNILSYLNHWVKNLKLFMGRKKNVISIIIFRNNSYYYTCMGTCT